MIPLLNAELCTALGRCAEALEFLSQYFEFGKQDNLARYQPKLIAQKAYCDAIVGNLERASMGYELAISVQHQAQDLDDLAVLLYRCSQAASILGRHDESAKLYDASKFSLAEFRNCQLNAQQAFYSLLDLEPVARVIRKK